MPKGVPLVYTVSWDDDEWKVWKGGRLSGRPSRVFDRKTEATQFAEEQSEKYNADGLIVQRKDGQIVRVKQAPGSFKTGKDIYSSPEAVIEVEYDEFGNFAWMVVSRWDNGLLGSGYSRRDDAEEQARELMEVINVKKIIVRNRRNSGTKEAWNLDAPEKWKRRGA